MAAHDPQNYECHVPCGLPLIWTFERRGAEWHCPECDWWAPMFTAGKVTKPATPELKESHDTRRAAYLRARTERERVR